MPENCDLEIAVPLIDDVAMAEWTTDLDPEDVSAILASVPDQCSACVHDIEAGMAEMQLAKVKRAAHKLKGMAANLGAARLSRLARRMEIEAQDLSDIARHLPHLKSTVVETMAALAARA